MTKNTVYLRTSLFPPLVNLYLSGGGSGRTPYSGSGTPWDAEATSPYTLALNDVAGPSWVPAPAPVVPILGGGPPFRIGRSLIAKSYDNVTESVGVQLYATSKDSAVALLRHLRLHLNSGRQFPCVLAVQGGTNTAYYSILYADVPESPDYIVEDNVFRAAITWVRSPFGGILSGETIATYADATEWTNGGIALLPVPTARGDLIFEGQPLTVTLRPNAVGSQTVSRIFAAITHDFDRSTTGSGAKTTSSTSFVTATLGTFNISEIIANPDMHIRLLLRGAQTANSEIYITCETISGDVFFTSKKFSTGLNGTLIDCGYLAPSSRFRQTYGMSSASITVTLYYRSTNGASSTYTHTHIDQLSYLTFCQIDPTAAVFPTDGTALLVIDSFPSNTNTPALPYTPEAVVTTTGSRVDHIAVMRGTAPLYIETPTQTRPTLYLAWLDTGLLHTASRTADVTVIHAPLYRTLRGGA